MTLPTIAFCILAMPPFATDGVYRAFERWGQYEAFTVQERCDGEPETVLVEWAPVQGAAVGLAYGRLYGYVQNRIVLDSTYGGWTADVLMQVTMHELGHIVLGYVHSRDRRSLMYFSGGRRTLWLWWDDMERLRLRWGRVRPIPPALVTLGEP